MRKPITLTPQQQQQVNELHGTTGLLRLSKQIGTSILAVKRYMVENNLYECNTMQVREVSLSAILAGECCPITGAPIYREQLNRKNKRV